MAKIIKEGNEHKLATCKHCKCLFSYALWETYKNRMHYYIDCPDCGLPNIVKEKKEA